MGPQGARDWRENWGAKGCEPCGKKNHFKYEEPLKTEEINDSKGLKCHQSFQ